MLEPEKKYKMINQSSDTKETYVYEKIKEGIIKNEFPPGTVMVERKLCELYNVSRSPIRNALRQLSTEGLLDVEQGIGIVVPIYTLEDILEVYDLLEVLQVYAISTSLKNYDDIAIGMLETIIENTKLQLTDGDLNQRMDWDVKFHEYIIHRVGNKRLDMIFELLLNQKRRFDITSLNDVDHATDATGQHEAILEAIKSGDVEESCKAIKEHLSYIKKYYINKLVTGKYNI
ncbi:GntR family transcriptional regulator [Eubacterium oxidoreducens]|uniref:DNA-binding transcriptional regulator, GntR family n=1 Tax=Eubacterium oxidoreducens TaxID=1732 RepID=A0A1G6C0P2_EUBOX|nr:GntR family transcriptional regulator [Eubacterium oxidoreducens]SDB26436.1 DNA-binding transcriptional regulator, GntR family [Eubacterium oxidoreducens]